MFFFCLEASSSRRYRRQRTEMIYQQVNDLPEDLPEDHITTPGQRRSSRRQRTTNYKDQDDKDLNLVPGPLLQENIQELEEISSDDTVNMLSITRINTRVY